MCPSLFGCEDGPEKGAAEIDDDSKKIEKRKKKIREKERKCYKALSLDSLIRKAAFILRNRQMDGLYS